MPLLGNPTAAVLYPGKLVFAVLPYAWAARIYIVAHSALAFLTMLVLMRSWGTSWFGSALSALAYAFGAPILFQYCNIIYLIGAAWLPLGIHAVDRWVRLGRRWGLLELAIVLSMQMLGGDPQAAYLLGLASIGYALGLAWNRARSSNEKPGRRETGSVAARVVPGSWWRSRWSVWCVVTLALAQWLPEVARARQAASAAALDALGAAGRDRRLGLGRSRFSSFTGGGAAGAFRWAPCGWAWPARPPWRSHSRRLSSCRSSSSPSRPAGRRRRSARDLSVQSRAIPTARARLAQYPGNAV